MAGPRFDWDEDNINHIVNGHEVEPEEAEQALADMHRVPGDAYRGTYGEKRQAVIGRTIEDRILFVVYTVRRGRIRVVTARDADPGERRRYQCRSR
jgi:uncharacterized DUF497 family protein